MISFFKSGMPASSRTVEVGWVIDPDQELSFIWEAPRKLTGPEARTTHAKGVSLCPAINDHEARLFEVRCPIDLHLRIGKDSKGNPGIIGLDGDQATIRPRALTNVVSAMPQAEWRHSHRPIIQAATPYHFLADEPVYITMLPAFYNYSERPLPGFMLGGRFPIHIWPRPLVWAFEWYNSTKDIYINRGDPWFYVNFETQDPSRHVRLVEAQMTPDLREYVMGMRGVTNYVNRTYSLFGTARQRRPEKLLVPRKR